MAKQTSKTKNPIVLMDIDGVLNVLGGRLRGKDANPHLYQAHAGRFGLTLDRRHRGWLDRLAQHAELRWATMWTHQARTHFAPVAGYGQHWPVLDFGAYWDRLPLDADPRFTVGLTGNGVGELKWPLILAALRENRPVVWIDDDMTDDHLRMAERRNSAGSPTLFIRPSASQGLTMRQYQRVLAFVSGETIVSSSVSSSTSTSPREGAAA